MPKISVVIPYYNDSKYIKECIDSVLGQTLPPSEVIIIDDHSEDSNNLLLLLQEINSSKISYIRNEYNMNGSCSRNIGINLATGDYIALLDADDYWHLDHLKKSYNLLINDKSDFIYSNVIELINNKEILRKVDDILYFKDTPFDILLTSPPQTNSFFFSAKIKKSIQFNEALRRHQDYQYFMDAITNKNINVSYMNEYTTYYRYRHKNHIKPIIDYSSIFEFWFLHYEKVNKKILNKKLWNIIAGGLRDKRTSPKTILKNEHLKIIFSDSYFYNFIIKLKNRLLITILVNIYFYIFIDKFKKIYSKFISKL